MDALFAEHPYQAIRVHGDCHPGNLLCRDESFFIVDLDDCRMGPAIQDLWMMLAGDYQERLSQLSELVDGYREFYDFSARELPRLKVYALYVYCITAHGWRSVGMTRRFRKVFHGLALSAIGASRF